MSEMDTEHFSPYRADGKLVSTLWISAELEGRRIEYWIANLLDAQYGFVCVVTGAQQPVGQAIIQELAGTSDSIL